MTEQLITKYRPKRFKDVIGQQGAVTAVQSALKHGTGRAFLLTGPSGVGKTTIARIIARGVKCIGQNLMEIDAATHTGIDAMRKIVDLMSYVPLQGGSKVVIVDECHALSKQAWQSLLKSVEEPPDHGWWVFCTTDASRVPKTIANRCIQVALRTVRSNDIADLLERVRSAEQIDITDEVLDYIARKSDGSPRMALAALAKSAGCKTIDDVADIVESAVSEVEIVDLCRELVRGRLRWAKARALCESLPDATNPESARLIIVSYLGKVLMGTKSDSKAARIAGMIEEFAGPYNSQEGIVPLLMSLAAVTLAD